LQNVAGIIELADRFVVLEDLANQPPQALAGTFDELVPGNDIPDPCPV
jgi:hypothetical protein